MDDSRLHAFAAAAIDAARQAGAAYADVRVGEQQALSVWTKQLDPGLGVEANLAYGVRVIVNGAWGFVHGHFPSVDALAEAARAAVVQARLHGRFNNAYHVELAPCPPPAGTWDSPIDIAPFTVPVRDQAIHLNALRAAFMQVDDISSPYVSFRWVRETRIFQSSEGGKVTQRFSRCEPRIGFMTTYYGDRPYSMYEFSDVLPSTTGYETACDPRLRALIKQRAEEARFIARLPTKPMDVGRYPVLMSGAATAAAIGTTLNPALELDRALGFESSGGGASFLAPPLEVLNAQESPFASELSLTASRAMPEYSAVQWDDEGVAPSAYTLVERGRVVDYHTTRETAMSLAPWYQARGKSVASNGCAAAARGDRMPMAVAGTVTMAPNQGAASLDALMKDMKHGIYVYRATVDAEPALATGMLHGTMLEVRDGAIVARLTGTGLLFRTKKLWKESLRSVGDATTTQSASLDQYKGQPWQPLKQAVRAPAAFFADVDTVTWGGDA